MVGSRASMGAILEVTARGSGRRLWKGCLSCLCMLRKPASEIWEFGNILGRETVSAKVLGLEPAKGWDRREEHPWLKPGESTPKEESVMAWNLLWER